MHYFTELVYPKSTLVLIELQTIILATYTLPNFLKLVKFYQPTDQLPKGCM